MKRRGWVIAAAAVLLAAAGLVTGVLCARGSAGELELGVICTPASGGSLVVAVLSGSAAQRAGVQPGDILCRIDGEECGLPDCLRRVSADTSFTLERGGVTMTRSSR